jgi:hypothetical protein
MDRAHADRMAEMDRAHADRVHIRTRIEKLEDEQRKLRILYFEKGVEFYNREADVIGEKIQKLEEELLNKDTAVTPS